MSQAQPAGYLAVPAAGQGSGVLVLHAWWGLNSTIRAVCDRLAEAGFIAFAPDLYHGKVADTIPAAEALVTALDANHLQAKAEIAAAVAFLNQQPGRTGDSLAVIGFSLGAYYALHLSTVDPQNIRSVVIFYGSGDPDFTTARADYLAHYAENDPYEPQSNIDFVTAALKDAGRSLTLYQYPGTGHWFFEPDRLDAYNPQAANLAWERTLAFLNR